MVSVCRNLSLVLVLSVFVCGAIGSNNKAAAQTLVLGSGGEGGVYYPVGRAICNLTNAESAKTKVKCDIKKSAGSVLNLVAMRAGKAQVAIAQSDIIYQGYHGIADFKKAGPDKSLRTLFSLYAEVFTLVAHRKSGIQSISDLVGKRVYVGARGSGHRKTVDSIMLVKGWNESTFSKALAGTPKSGVEAFCAGQLDAFTSMVGHPSALIRRLANRCGGRLVDVYDTEIATLIDKLPYYGEADIRSGIYKDVIRKIRTFGSDAMVLSSTKVPDKAVYTLVKSVFENFKKFKSSHQALRHLTLKQMVPNAAFAPVHSGAIHYFKEAGLM